MHKYRYEKKDTWTHLHPSRMSVSIYEEDELVGRFSADCADAIGHIEDSDIDAIVEAKEVGKEAANIVLARVLRKADKRRRAEEKAKAKLQRRGAKRVMRKYGI